MTINELSILEPMLQFRLVAGFEGLHRRVTSASLLEGGEDLAGLLQGVQAGDLVVSTLFFARDNPALVGETLRLLVEKDAAGLAVKTVYFQDLPRELKDFADDNQFPIFFFDDIRMTDLLFCIYDALNTRRESRYYEAKIRQMFPAEVPDSTILQSIEEINPSFQKDYYCAYLTPAIALASLHDQDALPRYRRMTVELRYSTLLRFEGGFLLLASFPAGEIPADQAASARELLFRYQLLPGNFYCGLSRLHHDMAEMDVALTEAFSANQLARREGRSLLCYQDMGIYQILLPQLRSKSFLEYIRSTRDALLEYDGKYHANLMETLQVYIACGGKLAQTAERMFLHVNTVRYRLDKARELLHMDDFFIQAYIFVKADRFLHPEDE